MRPLPSYVLEKKPFVVYFKDNGVSDQVLVWSRNAELAQRAVHDGVAGSTDERAVSLDGHQLEACRYLLEEIYSAE